MDKIWGSVNDEEEDAVESLTFGGVTATDFFGLLLVAQFVLMLLAALTLGKQGVFDLISDSDSRGATAQRDGVKKKTDYRYLLVECFWFGGERENGSDRMKLKDATGEILARYDVIDSLPGTPFRIVSQMLWESTEGEDNGNTPSFSQFSSATLTIPLPPRQDQQLENFEASLDLEKAIARRFLAVDQYPSKPFRTFLWAWKQRDQEQIAEQLKDEVVSNNLPAQLASMMDDLALIHIRTNFNGEVKSVYYGFKRPASQANSNQEKKSSKDITLSVDELGGGLTLEVDEDAFSSYTM